MPEKTNKAMLIEIATAIPYLKDDVKHIKNIVTGNGAPKDGLVSKVDKLIDKMSLLEQERADHRKALMGFKFRIIEKAIFYILTVITTIGSTLWGVYRMIN